MNFVDLKGILNQKLLPDVFRNDSMIEIKDIEGSEYSLSFSEIAYFKKTYSSQFLIFLKHPCIWGEEFDCISVIESDFEKLKNYYSVWITFRKSTDRELMLDKAEKKNGDRKFVDFFGEEVV